MQQDTFWVYVIELTDGALYVGETALTPVERFERHLTGGRSAAGVVARRGLRLRPDLFPPEGPFPSRQEARRFERRTANRLTHRGFRVYGGQGRPFMA